MKQNSIYRAIALFALIAPGAGLAGVVLDAPGHAAPEGAAVTARGGEPGAAWRVVDWRGREVEGAAGAFDERGEATLPPLPAGYYRMIGAGGRFVETPLPEAAGRDAPTARPQGSTLATLAVVAPSCRNPPCGVAGSPYAIDTALSWISRPGAFLCPWNGGDTLRTVADLTALAGFAHVRDRLRWTAAQPSPDAPPDFSRNLATADLFAQRGAPVSGMFHDAPPWAGTAAPRESLPADLNVLYRFCGECAAAFGDAVEDWEFWNEPDIHFCREPVWDYAAAMKAAFLGFKSARPDMPVLNGALCQITRNTPYQRILLDNDVAEYFDIFNYHTYLPPAKYPKAFRLVRDDLRRVGAGGKPIWVTEFGTNLEGDSDTEGVKKGMMAHSPEQELVHAEFYPKGQIGLMMEGVERAYFFVMAAFNERGGRKDWGVIRRDGTVKPIYAAMAAMNHELGDARLLGALATPPGIRAYLFEKPDGSQTVAFWSESPVDTADSGGGVLPTPDFAREWVLHPPAPAGGGALRLTDLCGMAQPAPAPAADGSITLAATRFPAYLAGLRGLSPAVPAIRGLAAGAPAPAPSPIVLRVALEPGDFEISNQKTLAVVKGYTGRMKVQVWNFGDTAKTGTVEVAGAALAGLPAGPIALGPRGSPPAEFECVLGPEDRSDRSNQISSTLVLWFAGNGERSSRLSMPLLFERSFLDTCDRADLSWRDPALWRRNSSATRDAVVFDGAEQALRFDGEWDDASIDRWMYPELPLTTPSNAIASLADARRFAFEVKSAQDKVENDFKVANVMLVFDDGTASDIYLWFAPPTGQWEKRYAEIPEDIDLGRVRAIRLGANPMGQRCTLWLRNLEILKPAPESCGIEDEKVE